MASRKARTPLVDGFRLGLILAGVAFIALQWTVAYLVPRDDLARKVEETKQRNTNLVRAFEEHSIRSLEAADAILVAIKHQYGLSGVAFDLPGYFADTRIPIDLVHNAIITDAAGDVVASSQKLTVPTNLADREHVRVHRAADTGRLFISKPVLARVNKQWSVILTRRINKPNGEFGGVVGVAIRPDYFSNFYSQVDLGPDGVVGLIGRDGIVRASAIDNKPATELGTDLQRAEVFRHLATANHGTFLGVSPRDGVNRVLAYRALADHPLIVTVGVAYDVAVRDSVRRARLLRIAAAAGSGLTILVVALLVALITRADRARGREEGEREAAHARLEEREARYRGAIETTTDGFLATDEGGRVIDVNEAYLRRSGFRREEVLELRLADLDAEGKTYDTSPIESTHRTKDGATWPVEIAAARVPNVGAMAFVRDLTERKQLEERRLQSQKLESLGTLAGGIAHDFNNLLQIINESARSAGEEMLEGNLTSLRIAQENISAIHKAVRRAADLVRRILVFARADTEGHTLVEPHAVVEEALELLQVALPKTVEIRFHRGSDVPDIMASAGQIQEALVNLGKNAADAIGDRPGHVDVRVERVQLDDGNAVTGLVAGLYTRIRVSDDGSGMSAETRRRIFDAFLTTKSSGQGTGLGLAMVHGIVRAHGGAIAVDSEVGKGSTFDLYFPAAPSDAREDTAAARRGPVASGPVKALRVLFVDDEATVVAVCKRSLERRGYLVTAFDDPRDALRAFELAPHDFDVVVTDLSMPHLTGLDVARVVRATRSDVHIVLATGYATANAPDEAKAQGVDAILGKPYAVKELVALLEGMSQPPAAPS